MKERVLALRVDESGEFPHSAQHYVDSDVVMKLYVDVRAHLEDVLRDALWSKMADYNKEYLK